MYLGKIEELSLLLPSISAAVEQARSVAMDKSRSGVTKIDGDNIFVISMEAETVAEEAARYEIHSQYIDVQVVLEGVEAFGVSTSPLTITEDYLEEKDVAFGDVNEGNLITLNAGEFILFDTQEVHKPLCTPKGIESKNIVKKAVIKILKSSL